MRPGRQRIPRWPGRRAWSRRWSCRSRRCISCAGRCWIAWTGCPARSVRLWGWRSTCLLGARRIGSWSAWRCWALVPEAAAGRPLLCLVDDAQWLDQAAARVLALVARRLDAETVALLFGTRDRAGEGALAGLPGLVVAGIADADARALLASVLPGRLDERVRDRIIAESGGNPLALLELPLGGTAAELAGGFGVAGPQPVTGRNITRCPPLGSPPPS